MPPCIIKLMHSHQVVQQLDGRLFDEIIFVDYVPTREEIEIALTRFKDSNGTVFIRGEEFVNWTEHGKSKRTPTIPL